ncbi:MAG: sulfite exporter TauE/SafE family protein [Nitrospira sp.]|nr:sulfite exporter TauE/SafE family protein [Nitrospira sp.]
MMWLSVMMLLAVWLGVPMNTVDAHPMGNFSINHYSGLEVNGREINVRYVLDLAEIPTLQEMQILDGDRNGVISESERERYMSEKSRMLADGLFLQVKGMPRALVPIRYELTNTPGAGGLPTIKISVLYRATVSETTMTSSESKPVEVFYRDRNYPGRAGWKEMAVAGGSGISVIGSMLPQSGGELRAYPEDEIKSPPQIVETRFTVTGGAVREGTSSGASLTSIPLKTRWSDTFTSLITPQTQAAPVILFSLLVAFGLGAVHALSPGHGKTVVAAYLVGSRGTAYHALLLGLTVTMSHTIGVFLLGLATLYFSKFFVPEQLYPWLAFFSGLTIFVMGLMLLRQRWRSIWTRQPFSHEHLDDHEHDHGDHHHHSHHHHEGGTGSLKGIVGLGITGGIIPCPSALVVLLSAIAFHQVAFGLLLIVAFSAGIAATLVVIGLLMVYLGEVVSRVERFNRVTRLLPVVSAAGVALLGGAIALGTWF